METPTPYCTIAHLKLVRPARLVKDLSDDDRDGESEDGVQQSAVDFGNSQVDQFIQLNPGLPITTLTHTLRHYALNFAIQYLFDRRGQVDDATERRLVQIEARLILISKGELGIGVIGGDSGIDPIGGNKTDDDFEDLTGVANVIPWGEEV